MEKIPALGTEIDLAAVGESNGPCSNRAPEPDGGSIRGREMEIRAE